MPRGKFSPYVTLFLCLSTLLPLRETIRKKFIFTFAFLREGLQRKPRSRWLSAVSLRGVAVESPTERSIAFVRSGDGTPQ
jgi:hypothetical protein